LFDRCLETLWNTLESLDEYRGRTTLIVTTDHGRGAKRKNWKSHGKRVEGAQFVWLAVIGPDTPSRGEAVASPSYSQNQTAATILRLLGLSWQEFNPAAGPPIEAAFRE
jgi:bisphosphoglycerate-independent phosphoglycerate mutase (AlkP superfamily)